MRQRAPAYMIIVLDISTSFESVSELSRGRCRLLLYAPTNTGRVHGHVLPHHKDRDV